MLAITDSGQHEFGAYLKQLNERLEAFQNNLQAASDAHAEGKPVSICGEMAGDPAAAILLMAMGFDSLSMNATNLPKVKWMLRQVELSMDIDLAPGQFGAEVEAVNLPRRTWHRRNQFMDLMTHANSLVARPEKGQPAALRQTKQTDQGKGHGQVDQRSDAE